jgi:ATP-dependent protease ClpP protease subunit
MGADEAKGYGIVDVVASSRTANVAGGEGD